MSTFTPEQVAEINSIITARLLDLLDAMVKRGQIAEGHYIAPTIGHGPGGELSGVTPQLAIVRDFPKKPEV